MVLHTLPDEHRRVMVTRHRYLLYIALLLAAIALLVLDRSLRNDGTASPNRVIESGRTPGALGSGSPSPR